MKLIRKDSDSALNSTVKGQSTYKHGWQTLPWMADTDLADKKGKGDQIILEQFMTVLDPELHRCIKRQNVKLLDTVAEMLEVYNAA